MKKLRLRKLLSGLLCAALVAGTVLGMGSRRVQAGLVANVVTGKWGAIAVSTLERSILFGLSKVESNTDSDTVADIMMWTKRIIAGNSANIAKQTLQTVKEIQAQLQSLYNYEKRSTAQMEDMLNKILSNEAKNNFVNGTYKDIRNFSNNYNQVLARYDALINSYIAYGEDPNETTKSALTVAYNDIYTAYYQSGTEKALFTDPLYGTSSDTGFLPSISPYNSAQAINETEDITDSSRWQRSDSIISGTTYLEQYMSCLGTFTAFESNQYEAMKGAANFAAVSAYNYLQAYRYYAELSSAIISSDSSSSAGKKDEDISGIWTRYNDAALKIQRGLNQMLSLYADVFDHYMLPYDTENTVKLKDFKTSENEYDAYTGYCKANGYNGIDPDTDEKGVYQDYTISNKIITEKQKLYQFKIAGDNKAYAIRESGGTNTPLLNQHTYAERDHVMFTTTTISYDLLSLLKGTANGYQVITSPAELSAITNPGSNPAYTQSDILTNYLLKELHNLVSDLHLPSVQARAESTSGDDIRGGRNFLLLRNNLYFDFDNSIDLVGDYKDMVAVWANASMPGMGTASMDLEDDIADNCGSDKPLYNQEMVVMFAGNPTSGISLEQNEGGSAVVEGPDKTLTSSGSMTVSGGSTLNVTVTPDAGKTVESVQLLDGNGTLLRQFAGDIFSAEDNSLLYTAQEYFDMISGEDGTLRFSLSAPYIDAKIRVTFKDIDSTLVKHKVTLLDKYDGENKAVVLQFGSYDYLSEKDYKPGEEVTVSVTGYSNYMPKSIKVTDSAGNTADVEVTDITDDSSRMMPSERIYRFKMPDYDLKISAETEAAFEVSVADSNTKHTFRDLNCYDLSGGKTWEDADAVTYAAGDTVHLSIEPDQGYVLDRVEVTAGRKTVPAVVKDDGITFTMPAENVSVKPVTSGEDVYNSYLAEIGKDADGAMLQFCMDNSEHTMLNVKSMQVKPGEKVLFTFVKTSDLYNASFTVTDSNGKNIDYKAESAEELYSFEMPESDVLLSVISTSRVKAVIQNTYLEDTEFAFVKSDGSHSADYQTYNAGETITVYTNNRSAFEHGVTVSDQDGTDITKTLAFSTDADAQTISFSAPDTKEITIIPVDIHHYENGICTVCGHFETPAARSDGYLEIKNAGNFFWYAAVVNQDHTHADFEDVIEGDTYMGAYTNAVLLNDIDLENIPFESIGYRHDYKGVFDGAGYTIRNFSADGSLGTCAMFGNMGGADAAVKNVTVQGKIDVSRNESLSENVTDWTQDVYLGLILMTDNEEDPLTVSHVVNDVDIVTGTKDIRVISGLVSGRTYSGKVTADHCTNYGTISCDSKRTTYVAGLFSNVSVNSASDCVNYGDMELKSSEQYCHYYGGIANLTGGIFERCVNFGNLHIEAMSDRYNSSSSAAGIVASYMGFAQLLLKDCANVGEITGTNGLAGGLAGNILWETILENCYNYGDLESLYSNHVGALITECNSYVRFENCYALDVIEGKTTFGDQITYASASQFLSGETGYKLNGGVTDGTQAWHQDIDNDAASKNGPDAYPLPFSTKGTIYEISAEEEYSNYEGGRPETVTYTIETETTGYGSVILTKPDTGDIAVSAQEGETIHAEIIPFEGYILASSTINGKDTGTDYGTFTDSFVMPGENIVVSVVFENTVSSYDIYTYEDLVNAANNVRSDPEHYAGATFRLMNDIDGNGADWTLPIGTAEVPFNGTFEGNDYIIQNLTIHEYAAQTNTILDSEEVEKGAADLSDGEEKTEKGTDILSNEGENAEEVKELLEGTSGEAEGSEEAVDDTEKETGSEEPADEPADEPEATEEIEATGSEATADESEETKETKEPDGMEASEAAEDPEESEAESETPEAAEDPEESEAESETPEAAEEQEEPDSEAALEAEGSETEASGISGLFGVIGEQGCVRHLATLAFNWAEDAGYAGGIAAINRGTIDYCSSGINIGSTGDESGYIDSDMFFADLQSSIRGSEAAGGISALNEGLISNTRNNSLVLDAAVSGGIVAVNKGTIINFYNLGHVFGTAAEGGVAGQNEGSISIGYTAFAMEVSGSEQSGQVVGSTTNTGFTDLYYSTEGNISGDGQDNGAFAGTVQKPDKEITSQAFADTLNIAAEGQGLGEWIYESSKNLGYPRIKAAVLVTKTLTGKYGITLTGQVHPDAKLETVELDGTSEDYQAMEASLTGSTMLAAYDISLRFANERRANMEGDLIITIPVEKAKKLEDLTVMHRHFGKLFDVKADKLENGAVQITVGRLSAFGIAQADSPEPTVIPTVTPEPTVIPTPTGTPVPTVTPTITPAPTVSPTATPAPTVSPTATPAPTVNPTATPEPTVRPTAAPGSGGNSRTDSVKTGDPNNTALPVILLICAGIALLTLFAVRRRTGGKDTE